MLQQTQVARVIPKYSAFLKQFPTVFVLAQSELGDVLRMWQGLGYNRRAKYLWQSARAITTDYNGIVPSNTDDLVRLPGIGINTAGAIVAYAYDKSVVFVETNIRTVYIHHFFNDQDRVSDTHIRALLEQTLPQGESIREWYWALMDYGTYIKQSVGNVSKYSSSYVKQSSFQGSNRQLRGAVLRALHDKPHTRAALEDLGDERMPAVIDTLHAEGLIRIRNGKYLL